MEEELQGHKKAQKEALTKTRLLEDTVKNLEYELETKSHLKEDRARQAKILEVERNRIWGGRLRRRN